jgi:glyoxylase-like metal-dependent hydrolase (beta-lactamase superfamily II)
VDSLRYEVFVNDGVRRARDMRLPDGSPIISSPVASTLVLGEIQAVLVDPPFTYDQINRVGDWIERSGKRLAYIYATHGHGDHWFGTDLLQQRFPGAVAYATVGTIAMMHQQVTTGRSQLWDVDFPGLIPPSPTGDASFRRDCSSSYRSSGRFRVGKPDGREPRSGGQGHGRSVEDSVRFST